ncbi:UDENN domain-containing protein [Aphelenchoides bicaudatus]|nr:UDENN domain-containing protein [Aphelenchoides bicaudatus]
MSHPILHVVVCGFNHKKGCQVDYVYPPFANSKSTEADDDLPKLWSNLPAMAIPDGSHNFDEDTIYFVLPSLEERHLATFGVACYRQIDTASLICKDDDVTRSHVQKSVCVLSKVPLYGVLTDKLNLITKVYFNEKDFSKVEVLKQMYNSLTDIFDYSILDQQSMYMGISLYPLLKTFGNRTLELFKLILLERRVCLKTDFLSRQLTKHQMDPEINKTNASIEPNEYGFPLSIFTKGNLLLPYLPLTAIDSLRSNNIRAYCIGVSNCIFRNNSDLHDAYIVVDKTGIANIYYSDADLEKQLALTTQDMRFMQNVLRSAENAKQNPAEFCGNDDWQRLQFWSYLVSMFRSSQLKNENLPEFNENFINAWSVTHNFRTWSRGTYGQVSEGLKQI